MALTFSVLDGALHDRDSFTCGVAALDNYLRQRAGQHHRDGIATTHVLIDDAQLNRILGYCTLSAAQLYLQELREEDRKRLPAYPVPAIRVGRLAVSQSEKSKGYGQLLLGHAVNLALSVRQTMGVRVLVVDAKDAQVAAYYEGFGFHRSVSAALTLYLPLG
ncbi:MAG: GNAT family N-acetyltransferase [Paludibacterium sp.]|uniref:GNAT family N-acetyltransferase n=1 Tax=Paludibacterium sp. TaxID=1917523 RepID=UPI0025D5756C|nr:GNAT family N-acetyltransferase [Paludibacterium sp.]MBV8048895.1 GNAT family N-acetyltransferase [Paludibacterium sp.]MBV8648406.1 GNAT family N-acetyltransferase [Paludibacterium sp.]